VHSMVSSSPPPDAVLQSDASFLCVRRDGSSSRYAQRLDGSWRKPEHRRTGWVGELEIPRYQTPHRRSLLQDQALSPEKQGRLFDAVSAHMMSMLHSVNGCYSSNMNLGVSGRIWAYLGLPLPMCVYSRVCNGRDHFQSLCEQSSCQTLAENGVGLSLSQGTECRRISSRLKEFQGVAIQPDGSALPREGAHLSTQPSVSQMQASTDEVNLCCKKIPAWAAEGDHVELLYDRSSCDRSSSQAFTRLIGTECPHSSRSAFQWKKKSFLGLEAAESGLGDTFSDSNAAQPSKKLSGSDALALIWTYLGRSWQICAYLGFCISRGDRSEPVCSKSSSQTQTDSSINCSSESKDLQKFVHGQRDNLSEGGVALLNMELSAFETDGSMTIVVSCDRIAPVVEAVRLHAGAEVSGEWLSAARQFAQGSLTYLSEQPDILEASGSKFEATSGRRSLLMQIPTPARALRRQAVVKNIAEE